MEAKWLWVPVTAVAPVTWGATYYVTRQFLPADAPLWGAALRALPAGLVLLAVAGRVPTGPGGGARRCSACSTSGCSSCSSIWRRSGSRPAWQLLAGAAALLVAAGLAEGPPPSLDGSAWAALGFVSLVATAVAFLCWFAGLARLPAGAVGLIGLLNPVTGLALGVLLAGEALTGTQVAGVVLVLAGIVAGQRGTGPPRRRAGASPITRRPPAVPGARASRRSGRRRRPRPG